jgi:8-oxo-dGTP diphosphatase
MKQIKLAGCVIKDDQGRILMLHRNTATRRQWEIPGGKLNPGEEASQTATRELQEELGIEVAVEKELGTRSFIEDGYTMIYTWFLARVEKGKPHPQESHIHDEFRYLEISKLQDMPSEISPNTRNLVNEISIGTIKL